MGLALFLFTFSSELGVLLLFVYFKIRMFRIALFFREGMELLAVKIFIYGINIS